MVKLVLGNIYISLEKFRKSVNVTVCIPFLFGFLNLALFHGRIRSQNDLKAKVKKSFRIRNSAECITSFYIQSTVSLEWYNYNTGDRAITGGTLALYEGPHLAFWINLSLMADSVRPTKSPPGGRMPGSTSFRH